VDPIKGGIRVGKRWKKKRWRSLKRWNLLRQGINFARRAF